IRTARSRSSGAYLVRRDMGSILSQIEPSEKPGPIHYDRTLLYKEVWAEPTQKVARKYGVSDVAIAKACAYLNVPKPPRGYWAKKAAGMKLPGRPALPAQ